MAFCKGADLSTIQTSPAETIGLELQVETPMGKAAMLKERILALKNVLIILDDLQLSTFGLNEIGIPSQYQLKQGKSKLLFASAHAEDRISVIKNLKVVTIEPWKSWHFKATA